MRRFARASALTALGLGVGLASLSATAHAEPTDEEKALATTLFDEARKLLAQGEVSPACRKFEESRRLDPQPGTILNLAACHEREGATASALAEFREARVLAARDHRDDRVAFADEHIADLEPRVSALVVSVPPEVDAPELRVSRDGSDLGRAAWGTRIPVDPGEHVIEAKAPRKQPWRVSLTVAAGGEVRTVVVPALEDASQTEPAPVERSSTPAPVAPPPRVERPPARDGLSTRRSIALAAAGVGVVGVGLGAFFGVRAIVKHEDPNATCTTSPCSATSVSLNDQAKLAADVSTVSFAAGFVGLAAAAVLWFGDTSARPAAARTTLSLAPFWSRAGGSGVAASGRW